MGKRKHLQEIYGEEDDIESLDFNKIISQLKEKYGEDWHKHVNEYVDELQDPTTLVTM